jgi:phosphoribosylformylglycinamidine synthase subunit PurL
LKHEGNMLIVIGREEGHLGQSLYQQYATGKFDGAPPPVDLDAEIKAGRLIRTLIREGRVLAVHDCSDGGLLVAIAEMALAGGKNGLSREASGVGVELYPYEGKLPAHAIWFGEDQGRYVVEVTPQKAEEVLERARLLELPARIVGRVSGDAIGLKGETALPLSELRTAHESFLPKLMGV